MIGAPGGGLDFAGQYSIVAPDSGRITAFQRFSISVPPQGEGYPGLLADHARAIESLADRIAASITGRRAVELTRPPPRQLADRFCNRPRQAERCIQPGSTSCE